MGLTVERGCGEQARVSLCGEAGLCCLCSLHMRLSTSPTSPRSRPAGCSLMQAPHAEARPDDAPHITALSFPTPPGMCTSFSQPPGIFWQPGVSPPCSLAVRPHRHPRGALRTAWGHPCARVGFPSRAAQLGLKWGCWLMGLPRVLAAFLRVMGFPFPTDVSFRAPHGTGEPCGVLGARSLACSSRRLPSSAGLEV